MSIQSLSGPGTIEVCSFTLDKMISRNCELQKENKEVITELKVTQQAYNLSVEFN